MARKGLPKSIIKKYGISKKAWAVYRGKKSKGSNPRPKKARKVKKMARRRYSRKRSRRSGGMTIPLAPIIGLGAGLAGGSTWSGGNSVISRLIEGDFTDAMKIGAYHYLGYDINLGKFEIQGLMTGIMPLVVGALIHKFVGGAPLNVNRMLAAAKVPFVRI